MILILRTRELRERARAERARASGARPLLPLGWQSCHAWRPEVRGPENGFLTWIPEGNPSNPALPARSRGTAGGVQRGVPGARTPPGSLFGLATRTRSGRRGSETDDSLSKRNRRPSGPQISAFRLSESQNGFADGQICPERTRKSRESSRGTHFERTVGVFEFPPGRSVLVRYRTGIPLSGQPAKRIVEW